jgi:hypothetical protein
MPGQIGIKTEVTPGTAVTPDTFFRYRSEDLRNERQILKPEVITSFLTDEAGVSGGNNISGSFTMPLSNVDIAVLLNHCFGAVNTTGAGPYTHTFTPGSLAGKAFTLQKGVEALDGTVHPFTYAGCKVTSWEITAEVDAIAQMVTNVIGQSETTATALASQSLDAGWVPFSFVQCSLTVGAVSRNYVRSLTLAGDNALEARRRLGSVDAKEGRPTGQRAYTGTISNDFEDLTDYGLFVAGTESALVATFDNGTDSLVITANIQYDGDTPGTGGPGELVEQSLPFTCVRSTDDGSTITAVLINGESSAA